MQIWMIIGFIWLVIMSLALAWSGMKLNFSAYQLKARDKLTEKELWELKTRSFWLSLQLWLVVWLVVIGLLLVSFWLELWQSIGLIIGLLMVANFLAKQKLVVKFVNRLWQSRQLKLKNFQPPKIIQQLVVLRSLSQTTSLQPPAKVSELNELKFLLRNSQAELGETAIRTVAAGLSFSQLTARDIAVAIKNVRTIKPSDVMGPLMVSELHQTGQKVFPVMINRQVVGVIELKSLIKIGDYRTNNAEALMNQEFLAVTEADNLRRVLKKMINQDQVVAIVKRNSQAVGIITLEQIVAELLGA